MVRIIDLSRIVPHAAGPNEVKTITPLSETQQRKTKVDKAYILSCVNGRLEDFEADPPSRTGVAERRQHTCG